MSWFFLVAGLALLVLDRVIDRATVLIFQERVDYYVFYYRPMFQRKQFFWLIFLAILVSIFVNYLIFHTVNTMKHVMIFLLLILLIYGMILLLTLFDSLVLKDIDRRLHFYQLENDFIQVFSLGLFFPLIYVAFILKYLLEIFKYPSQGIYVFKSFGGLTGLLSLSISLIMHFLR